MKIAISTSGETLDSPVDPRFGRAAGFLVVDTDTGAATYATNAQNLSLAQGAGIQAAMNVANTGATTVITGHVGPKAFTALSKGNIAIYFAEGGSVAQALAALAAGTLEQASGADKPGHW
ncbi:MAG: NifB/NifX family molybdenum-iron cluster-binding protein [Desulfovibrionaceae bacterium]